MARSPSPQHFVHYRRSGFNRNVECAAQFNIKGVRFRDSILHRKFKIRWGGGGVERGSHVFFFHIYYGV